MLKAFVLVLAFLLPAAASRIALAQWFPFVPECQTLAETQIKGMQIGHSMLLDLHGIEAVVALDTLPLMVKTQATFNEFAMFGVEGRLPVLLVIFLDDCAVEMSVVNTTPEAVQSLIRNALPEA